MAEAINSSMVRRAASTRGELVWMSMPFSAKREQAGTSTRERSSSTTHTRQSELAVKCEW